MGEDNRNKMAAAKKERKVWIKFSNEPCEDWDGGQGVLSWTNQHQVQWMATANSKTMCANDDYLHLSRVIIIKCQK